MKAERLPNGHMFLEKGQVLWNKKIGSSYYKMGLKWSGSFYDAKPGQFVMLRIDDRIAPLLRRPFSIYRIIEGKKGSGNSLQGGWRMYQHTFRDQGG